MTPPERNAAVAAADTPASGLPHIAVCICTYKRPPALARLLAELEHQETAHRFTYSAVVCDNDGERSAEATVALARERGRIPIDYVVEPRRNIALARNCVVGHARGAYLAWIDDDEIPHPAWLLTLLNECEEYGADGVLGPVLRHFDQQPPKWFRRSRIYVRRVNKTGTAVDWHEARTGNVLIRQSVIAGEAGVFRPQFRAGEDQDFFRRKIEQGFRFIWSSDAAVREIIPPARWKPRYILRKAMLQGATAALQPDCGAANIGKSLVAVPLYLAAAPFALMLGRHRFMSLMIKICDHAGKLLMRAGINPIREEYVSE